MQIVSSKAAEIDVLEAIYAGTNRQGPIIGLRNRPRILVPEAKDAQFSRAIVKSEWLSKCAIFPSDVQFSQAVYLENAACRSRRGKCEIAVAWSRQRQVNPILTSSSN